MATINQVEANLRKVQMDREAAKAVRATAGMIVELNKEQLRKGFDGTGRRISPKYRRPEYAQMKAQMNPLPGLGIPDLELTGEFKAGMGVDVNEDEYEVFSTDVKAGDLERKYGPLIMELGPREKDEYAVGYVAPALQESITRLTGLEFE